MNVRTAMPMRNAVYCFLAALIWGLAFSAQKVGGDDLGAFTFIGYRYLMGALVLLPLVLARRRARNRRLAAGDRTVPVYDGRDVRKGGILCGLFLFCASVFQQIPIAHVEVGKAGFLTALYIILVPILNFLLTKRSSRNVWIAASVSLVGLFLLCGGGIGISAWDLLLIFCAFLFSLQIMTIDHYSALADVVELSCIQFLVSGIAGMIPAIVLEHPQSALIHASRTGIVSLLYAGIFSSGIAYTFQMVGQKGADPAIASLILSLESVISAIGGFLILHQSLGMRATAGCIFMFAAIVIAQLPEGKRGKV